MPMQSYRYHKTVVKISSGGDGIDNFGFNSRNLYSKCGFWKSHQWSLRRLVRSRQMTTNFVVLIIMLVTSLTQGFVRSNAMLCSLTRAKNNARFRRAFCATTGINHTERKRIVFLGSPQFAADSLQSMVDESKSNIPVPFDVVAVVTQPPSQDKKYNPVHKLAGKLNIPLYTPQTAKDVNFLAELETLNVDLCITAAYGNFLPKRFLSIPKLGTVNIHPSLLPLYRGAAPVQRSLENGDASTGVSVAFTVLKMDAGPIIAQIPYPLTGVEKAPEVLTNCFKLGTKALLDSLPSIFDGTVKTTAQIDADATHAPKLCVQDSIVDFNTMNARTIHNRCRAYQDWPGLLATFRMGGSVVKAKLITTHIVDGAPGSAKCNRTVDIVKHAGGKKPVDMLRVVCGDGSVLGILEVTPAGRKQMDIKSLLNGLRGKGDTSISWADHEELQ